MLFDNLQDAGEVFELIEQSETPVIVHYWNPGEGPESPLTPIFWEADQQRGDEVKFVIVNSGFIHPQHSPDEMPLTVLYKQGEEVDTAFSPPEIHKLIEKA